MEGQRGRVYSPARRSGKTLILKLRAEDVTFEEFAATVSPRMWLATEGPTQGYQTILFGDDKPIRYGAFVFEGADIKAVEAALTEEWGTGEEVLLAEHLVDVVYEFPRHLTDGEIRAIQQQLGERFKILAIERLH